MSIIKNISTALLQRAVEIRKGIDELETELSAIFSNPGTSAGPAKRGRGRPRKSVVVATSPTDPTGKKPRRKMSAKTKAAMAAAAKARWAKVKASGKNSL